MALKLFKSTAYSLFSGSFSALLIMIPWNYFLTPLPLWMLFSALSAFLISGLSILIRSRRKKIGRFVRSGSRPAEAATLAKPGNGGQALTDSTPPSMTEKQARRLLEQGGLDPSKTYDDGASAAHLAAYDGRVDQLQALAILADSESTDIKQVLSVADCYDQTPAHHAAAQGKIDVLRFLKEKSCDLDTKDSDDATPAHLAAYEGHTNTLKYLITQGANLEARDAEGRTPAHLAALAGRSDTLTYLRNAGASMEAEDKDGIRPSGYLEEFLRADAAPGVAGS